MLAKIRRIHLRDGLSIREVSRRTGLSKNTVKRWLRQEGVTEPKYPKRDEASVVDAWAEHLAMALQADARRPVRERRTVKALFEQIQALGYQGSYPRVVVWVRRWRQAQADAPRRAAFVPLSDGMGLTLSPDKTRITDPADGFQFLGHRVSMRWDDRFGWSPRIEVPKTKAADLRHKVKQLTTRQTLHWSLDDLLQKLNAILRGWAYFYCYCTGAKDVLGGLDWYVGDRVWRWMRKKHPEASVRWLLRHRRPSRHRPTRRVWQGDRHEQYQMGWLKVQRYKRGWMTPPDFTLVPGEPDA